MDLLLAEAPSQRMQFGIDDENRLSDALGDRYESLSRVGDGGMGVVYRAYDKMLGINVAIKVLKGGQLPDVVRRFQQEARAAAKLKHKNVIRELDCGILANGDLYLVMEFADGISLDELIEKRGPLSCRQALPIFLQIVEGVAHAHAQGLLHRDLKPGNVLIVEQDGLVPLPKIVDFGLSIMMASSDDTTGKGLAGSPQYMSPEAANAQGVDVRSDIYSLGCLMMQCLTSSPPFTKESVLDVIVAHRNEEPDKLSDRLPARSFPRSLEIVVDRCLKKNPDERYQTAEDLYRALAIVKVDLEEEALPAVQPPKAEPVSVPKSSPSRFKIAALLLFALILIGGILYSGTLQTEKEKVVPAKAAVLPTQGDGLDNKEVMNFFDRKFGEREALGYRWVHNNLPVDDEALKELGYRKDLERLWLQSTDCTGTGFKYLQGNKLVSVALINCNVTPSGLAQVANFREIKVLRLLGAPLLTDDSLRSLLKFQALETLYLCGCKKITAAGVSTLSQLTKLKRLSLNDMPQLSDDDILPLAKLSNLECLSLENTSLGAMGLKALKKIKHLSALDVGSTAVSDADLDLVLSPSLEALSLSRTAVSSAGLKKLKSCAQLKYLDLRGCRGLGREKIYALQTILPRVTIVNDFDAGQQIGDLQDDLLMWIPSRYRKDH